VGRNSSSYIEFAYNRVVHSTTSHSPFEVVYGFNSMTPLNLIPLPTLEAWTCQDRDEHARFTETFILKSRRI